MIATAILARAVSSIWFTIPVGNLDTRPGGVATFRLMKRLALGCRKREPLIVCVLAEGGSAVGPPAPPSDAPGSALSTPAIAAYGGPATLGDPGMTDWHRATALAQGRAIAAGKADPVALTEMFLERIGRLDAGRVVYIRTTPERALSEARAAARRAKGGTRLGPLDGVALSWKDLYDSAGTITTAGSKLLANRVPNRDATVLARATRAGLVCLGKTTMSELAFSGLGINPSFGTPPNPFDRATARVPGGSSSGAAVSVARGLAAAGIGSDTGGSVRIPAAWNGLVGLKTTFGLLPLDGVLPLSPSLDTVGPLTRDVADANAILAVLAGRPAVDLSGASLKGTRLAIPTDHFFERTEPAVLAAFAAAVEVLAKAGAAIVRVPAPEVLEGRALIARHGLIASIEADAAWHEAIAADPDAVFHMVRDRIAPGARHSGRDYIALRDGFARLSAAFALRLAGCDAMIAPTVAGDPPEIQPLLESDAAYTLANALALFNASPGNWLTCTAVSVPCGGAVLPVGLMLMQRAGHDGQLLRLAAAAEAALAAVPKPALPQD